jgi:methylisocitrate lyase
MINAPEIPWGVSAHDGLTAKLGCEAGFDVITAGGTSIAAALGLPDIELQSMTENLAVTRAIVTASSVPVVADIDTGYGSAINVMRTIREFEQIGAAGVLLEDQVSPKICPLMGDPQIISLPPRRGQNPCGGRRSNRSGFCHRRQNRLDGRE